MRSPSRLLSSQDVVKLMLAPKGKVWMLLYSLASLELLRVGMKRMEVHCKGHIPGRNKLFSSVTSRIKSSSS